MSDFDDNERKKSYNAHDGEYSFVSHERTPYSDAGYVPSGDASQIPMNYHCPEIPTKKEKKAKREKKARRGMSAGGVVALCLVCAILASACSLGIPFLLNMSRSEPASADATPRPTSLNVSDSGPTEVIHNTVSTGQEMSPTDIYYNLATKQVVAITTEITYTNVFGYTSSGAVSGSGFIISSDGYILTNNHVIQDAVSGGYDVKVLTYSGEEYIATIVGYEEENDVAVLKIDATGLSPVTIGNSDDMLVGQKVYAVGNPLGELEYTMTDGMVSALDREITSYNDASQTYQSINMFQISAAINEGNSGGPVYNSRGEVVGITTAKYSSTGVEGLGFAIPINDAVRIAEDLMTSGYVRGKAYMGVGVRTVSASAAQYYNMVEGAYVASVTEGSSGDKAGLKVNDIIVGIDDTEIKSRNDLLAAKKEYRAGETATLKVYREGEYIDLVITFDEETPQTAGDVGQVETQQEEQSGNGSGSYGEYGNFDSYEDFFNEFFGFNPFGARR